MEFGNGFQLLGTAANAQEHQKMLVYFEKLKSSDEGLGYSMRELLNGEIKVEQEELTFLHWKVLEFHVKHRNNSFPPEVRLGLRDALLSWLDKHSCVDSLATPTYLLNKSAQVFALVFANEFLTTWSTMMLDVMKICLERRKLSGIDFYLRILLAIDSEVVDRVITHSEIEQIRNTNIKDTMRESCIPSMVESWYNLLVLNSRKLNPSISSMCMNVIGCYIEWIDINMIANERFLPLIFSFLNQNIAAETREATCDCLREISCKGMMPPDKLRLIEVLWPEIKRYCAVQSDEDIDYVIKLSRLVGGVGSTLIFAWNKYIKSDNIQNIKSSSTRVQQNYLMMVEAIEDKTQICFGFFGHEDDDVSQQCIQFALDYIDMLKKLPELGVTQKQNIGILFDTLVKKCKYDQEYCFENEGEDEAEFKDFLKILKNVHENLILLQPDFIQTKLLELLQSTLPNWQKLSFSDVEVGIRLLYLLGESLAVNLGTLFSNESKSLLQNMMVVLTSSGVCNHPHPYVRLMFFETVVRYDKFFILQTTDASVLFEVTRAFLDQRGIKSQNPMIRSRCAYLLSRFIKTTSKGLQSFSEQLLNEIQDLLILSPSNSVDRILSNDDQLFIYELAGTLIVNSNSDVTIKNTMMTNLLRPLVEGFTPLLSKMHEVAIKEQDDEKRTESIAIAKTINYAMSYASRTSKAFSNKHTMAQAGCSDVYTETLRIFLTGFDVEVHHDIIHSGIRQYLHRMVICLEEEVLPFIPIAVHNLLKHCNARALHQFIPLINQIVNKFKKSISPFLVEIFMPVVKTVFRLLSEDRESEDAKTVRRTYFQFIHAIVSNNLTDVLLSQQPHDSEMVLLTLKQGAVDYPDPLAQKVCFNIFHKFLDSWKSTNTNVLYDFIMQIIIPSCFQAPMQPTFDLTDAQTVLVLKETSSIMKDLFTLLGNKVTEALRGYLPTLNIATPLIDEYCQALAEFEAKQFRNYTKSFFERCRR